jgi:hypothetical protein
MMPSLDLLQLIDAARKSLGNLLLPQPSDRLAKLGLDCLLEVLNHLTVWDVITLRLVARRYFVLTYTPVIWKRLIAISPLKLPPLPPTEAHAIENISIFNCEQLLRRAQALEGEWIRDSLRAAHSFVWAFHPSHNMALLPGGRYLVVACEHDAHRSPGFVIWDLEFPSVSPFMPDKRRAALAWIELPGYVQEMTAKYMTVFEQKTVMVAAAVTAGPKCVPAYTSISLESNFTLIETISSFAARSTFRY